MPISPKPFTPDGPTFSTFSATKINSICGIGIGGDVTRTSANTAECV
jgi:hypothetical protein